MAKKTFEDAFSRLEEIVRIMEENETGLDESVKLYKEGMELAVFCGKKLDTASNTVKQLKESVNGELFTENFTKEAENHDF